MIPAVRRPGFSFYLSWVVLIADIGVESASVCNQKCQETVILQQSHALLYQQRWKFLSAAQVLD